MNHQELIADRFYEKCIPITETGCWIWIGATRGLDNYGAMRVGNRTIGAHRVSYVIHNGNIPRGLQVLHRCDVRHCVNPDHLFVGTQKDNIRDMLNKGRGGDTSNKGESHPACKINESIVKEIRESSLSQKELRLKYGISQSHIHRIINKQSWRHCE